MGSTITIKVSIKSFLEAIRLSRSPNTARTYSNALQAFSETLDDHNLPTEKTPIEKIDEESIAWFAKDMSPYAPSSEQVYLTAVVRYFEYLAAEQHADINLPRVRMLMKLRARRPGKRLPQFPRDAIDKVLSYAKTLKDNPYENEREQLRNFRDRAFILTLADTGLRVHEACKLRRGDIDWNEGKALIIGKGNQQDIARFSSRSMRAIKDYMNVRGKLDGSSGLPLSALPLFARHDRGAGSKVKPISTATGRNIVNLRVKETLGMEAVGKITPHSFRHYFVTTVLLGSKGNLKLAQELARHRNIAVTQRYAHLTDDELDKGYWEIFEE